MADLNKAISWLELNGRPLDLALVQFEVTNQPQPVLDRLENYANADGGFGHALEPDVRLGSSSVLATTVALQILSRCLQPASSVMVAKAMGYLNDTFDVVAQAWPIVPDNVDDAAHAPWWKPRSLQECRINPRAEIVGYMHTWPELCDPKLRETLTQQLMETLDVVSSLEMHDLLVFDRLARSKNFPTGQFKAQLQKFYDLAASAISTNPSEWAEYGLTPLTLIDKPQHALASQFQDALKLNLEYLADTQNDDGCWSPPWSWFGAFADDWPAAEKDIKSLVTRESINLLRRFDGLR